MPDLGRYAAEVLAAYGVSALIMALLVGGIWLRGTRMKRQLAEIEARRRRADAKD
ncbi:heme exporter protein CcmD [Alkalilacustris brevis]|uniref:heme exporter protein CcmD n=1 Tax=Alkalilacustris brevis TaxID=2026338 RepID=UPI003B75B3CE